MSGTGIREGIALERIGAHLPAKQDELTYRSVTAAAREVLQGHFGAATLKTDPEKYLAGEYERRLLNLDPKGPPVELYRPSGDLGNGYRGRTGIYELIAVDDHMRTMIHDGSSEQELERYARSSSPGIRDDGRKKVMLGETTLEEVLRVTRED